MYAWIGLLNRGVINDVLLYLGVIDEPLTMLYNDFAVYLGIVYSYLPFMILPLYANSNGSILICSTRPRTWAPAAGACRRHAPLVGAGHVGGCLWCSFPPSASSIPALLGGADTLMIGRVLWDEFFISRDWPVASAVSIILVLLLWSPRSSGSSVETRSRRLRDETPLLGLLGIVAFGYAFPPCRSCR